MLENIRSIFTKTSSGEIALRVVNVLGCEEDAISCRDISSFEELLQRSVGEQSASLPLCLSIGSFAFNNCDALNSVYIPLCTNLGGTTGDDSVFDNANERDITITIPASLMTNNSGNPDGDIQYLQVEDNTTITQV